MTEIADPRLAVRIEVAARRYRALGIALPIAIATSLAVAQLRLLPELPSEIATHWGADGRPDGFGPAWLGAVVTLVIGVAMPLAMGLPMLQAMRQATGPAQTRFLAASSVFVVVLVGVLTFGAAASQIGIADVSEVPSIFPLTLGSFALAGVAGGLVWRFTLVAPSADAEIAEPDPLRVHPSEQIVWMRDVTMGRTGRIVVLAAVLVTVAGAVFSGAVEIAELGHLAVTWIVIGVALLLGFMVLAFARFQVRIDRSGFTARSALGWPGVHIPVAEIARVEVVQVNPMAEFGGWGWRVVPSAGTGIVLRGGAGLRVTRVSGRFLTVTVDDAETAAALLRGLIEGARA